MTTFLKSYNIYINSSQALYSDGTSIELYLPFPIVLNNIIPSEFRVYVERAIFPFCWSQFNSVAGNTTFSWNMIRGSTPYSGTGTIPDGNYTIKSLCQALLDVLTSQIDILTSGSYTPVFTFSYDSSRNRLTIFNQGDVTPTDIVISPSLLCKALGFSDIISILDPTYKDTSDINCDVSPSRSLYISSNTLQQNSSWSSINTPFESSNILTMIPIDKQPLLLIQHQPAYPVKTTLTNNSISIIELTLRDAQLNKLVGMDLPWELLLIIEEHRVDEKLKDFYDKQASQPIEPNVDPELVKNYKEEQMKELEELKKKQEDRLQRYKDRLNAKKNNNISNNN
jgi:hypothetical protein